MLNWLFFLNAGVGKLHSPHSTPFYGEREEGKNDAYVEMNYRSHARPGKPFLSRQHSPASFLHTHLHTDTPKPQYAPEDIPYGISRYQNETRRLYSVLDSHLADNKVDYLVGNKFSIADIAHWGWISAAGWAGIDIDAFPHLKAWEERLWARPSLQKGANVPSPYNMVCGSFLLGPKLGTIGWRCSMVC